MIGSVGGDALELAGSFAVAVEDLTDAYEGAIPAAFLAG